jgi:uncharacterized protein YybS (DUF2232 family)
LYLIKYGLFTGNRFIIAGAGLSLFVGLVTQTFDLLFFSLSLLPAGYMLAQSGMRGDSPAYSGLKGTATLVACWALLIGGIGLTSGVSPYGSLIDALNSGIDEAISHYRQNETLAPDALMMLETTLMQMKVVMPIIMPAIFFSCALFLVWFTMVIGNRLAVRFCNREVWPRYRYWRLPDKLIWLVIGSAVLSFLPFGVVRSVAVNLLILLSIIYCFQGFSVCVFFMNKWNVPLLFRSFIYVMIVFQSFGTLLLLIIGVADIWFDYRKLSAPETGSDKDTTNE